MSRRGGGPVWGWGGGVKVGVGVCRVTRWGVGWGGKRHKYTNSRA